MIIFYDKDGTIVGKIDGRKHTDHVLNNVWIGDNTERLIIDWQRTGKEYDEEYSQTSYEEIGVTDSGKPVLKPVTVRGVKKKREYEPQCKQKKLLAEIERGDKNLFDYKIKDGKLVSK